jgi:hypothetical protein
MPHVVDHCCYKIRIAIIRVVHHIEHPIFETDARITIEVDV